MRGRYSQDWLSDSATEMTWRLRRETAGAGALSDLGSHLIDLSYFLTGRTVQSVTGHTETVIPRRRNASGAIEEVTVDDMSCFYAKLDGEITAQFDVSRIALGRKNALEFELYGSLGSLRFELERMNELQYFDGTRPATEQGFTRILVTENDHPYINNWWPSGHVRGYDATFTNQVAHFLTCIHDGTDPAPAFEDGLRTQLVIDAVQNHSQPPEIRISGLDELRAVVDTQGS